MEKITITGKNKPTEIEFHDLSLYPEMLIVSYTKETTINHWINKEDAQKIVDFLTVQFILPL